VSKWVKLHAKIGIDNVKCKKNQQKSYYQHVGVVASLFCFVIKEDVVERDFDYEKKICVRGI